MSIRTKAVLAAVSATLVAGTGAALAAPTGTFTGPSTTTAPYVLPAADGVSTESLLTVGDSGSAGNGYEMVGIPDGLGAYRERGSRDFTLLMNQELNSSVGVTRRHGAKGAFISEYSVDPDTFEIEDGKDMIDPGVKYWDYPTRSYGTKPSNGGVNGRDNTDTFIAQVKEFSRFCSSSLTDPGILNGKDGRGYPGQLYFANEESGNEGRVFGVTPDGQAQQLPRLGLASWENTNVAKTKTNTTVSIGNEDGADGQLWVHVGTKQRSGNPFDKAGLTNGSLYVVDLQNEAISTDAGFRSAFGKGNPAPVTIGANELVNWDRSGARQNSDGIAKGLSLNRVEDGAFDPTRPNDYYFLTTEGGDTTQVDPPTSRDGGGLWRLRFNDVADPSQGAKLELLLDGSEAPYLNKPDNMTIDGKGNLLIQEDPGNNAHLARIVAYNTKSGDRGVVAKFDPAQFITGAPGFITQDEESSGIIDASKLIAPGWFLFDAQVHKANPDTAAVEYGQLLAINVRQFKDVYDIDG
ncbi:MAG: DUF839 domain-containing protein [Solirubrobacterales bacterium]